jgi:YaiO family outer membrane protein
MRRHFLFLFALFFLIEGTAAPSTAHQDQVRERAAAAIKSKEYTAAITICLGALRQNPLDYEFNFLLSRAYAYSGQWDRALAVLNELALAHPENTDVLLFRARIRSWQKDYRGAEKGYSRVLNLSPDNPEALTGLAEIASWQGHYAKAIDIYGHLARRFSDNPDLYFRLGRVYLWEGNYNRAKENLSRALRLDPGNAEYKQVLRRTSPRFKEKFELRYEYQTENFRDRRENYRDENLVLQLNLFPRFGPVLLKFNQAARAGQKDSRFGFELYPHLWKKAYAYLDVTYSPRATLYPESLYQVELYQGVLASAELSLGFRRMTFLDHPVSMYLGSLAYYFGKYYAVVRLYSPQGRDAEGFSWMANLRRYFSEENYIFAGCGQGLGPAVDIVTLEDVLMRRSRFLLTGFNWYVFQRIRLQLYLTLRDRPSLARTTLFLSTGYRW